MKICPDGVNWSYASSLTSIRGKDFLLNAVGGVNAEIMRKEYREGQKSKFLSLNEMTKMTIKPGHLYLHVFKWPATGKFELPGLQSKVTKAYLLADRKELKVDQTDAGVSLALPAEAPDKIASVICLEIADEAAK